MRRSSVVWMAAGLGAAMGLGVAFADAAGGPATSTAHRW